MGDLPLSKSARRVGLALVLFVGVAVVGLAPSADGDVWWHLAAAREMVRTRALMTTDPFSVSAGGRPWANVHWLFQLGLYGVYQLGGLPAVVLVKCLLVGAGAVNLVPGRHSEKLGTNRNLVCVHAHRGAVLREAPSARASGHRHAGFLGGIFSRARAFPPRREASGPLGAAAAPDPLGQLPGSLRAGAGSRRRLCFGRGRRRGVRKAIVVSLRARESRSPKAISGASRSRSRVASSLASSPPTERPPCLFRRSFSLACFPPKAIRTRPTSRRTFRRSRWIISCRVRSGICRGSWPCSSSPSCCRPVVGSSATV